MITEFTNSYTQNYDSDKCPITDYFLAKAFNMPEVPDGKNYWDSTTQEWVSRLYEGQTEVSKKEKDPRFSDVPIENIRDSN